MKECISIKSSVG